MITKHPLGPVIGTLLALILAGCGGNTAEQAGQNGPGANAPTNAPAANAPTNGPHTGHTMDHSQMPSMARLAEATGDAFDAAFMSQMIEHHAGAVTMSQAAAKKAKRPEIKEATAKIIAEQKREIAQMTGWLKDWYKKEPDSEMRSLMKKDMETMMSAFERESEQDADRAFLTHMKMHHQMAVDMAKMAEEKAAKPELRELAKKMRESQAKEIAQFDTWLEKWYPL